MTWQERLQTEFDELAEKLIKLEKFFDTSEYDVLAGEDKYLLKNQCSVMRNYRMILNSRIQRLTE